MGDNKRVIIVGAGITGISTAYYLNKAGLDVTIIDKDEAGDNCSYGNAGMIVPSHFIPLSSPGVVGKGLRWMLKADSPFYIKPRFNKDLINWGWKFMRAATEKRANAAAPVLKDLLLKNRELLIELEQIENLNFGLQKKGLFMFFNTNKGYEDEKHIIAKANKLNMPAKLLSAAEVKKMEPNLKMNILGAGYYPDDAHFYPGALMDGLKAVLKRKEVKFLLNSPVKGLVKRGETITGVQTSGGKIHYCSDVVICTGAWTPSLNKAFGISLPMQAGKGYSITIKKPKVVPNHCSMLSEAYVAVTPMNGTLRFAGTMEMTGLDTSINQKKITALKKAVSNYLPDYSSDNFLDQDIWVGLRPCSPDGLPYVGKLAQYTNAYVSTGHAMLGMSLGLISGKIISNLIKTGETESNHSLMHPDRYN